MFDPTSLFSVIRRVSPVLLCDYYLLLFSSSRFHPVLLGLVFFWASRLASILFFRVPRFPLLIDFIPSSISLFRIPSRSLSSCVVTLSSTCRQYMGGSSPVVFVLYTTSYYTCDPLLAIYTSPPCHLVILLSPWYSTTSSCPIFHNPHPSSICPSYLSRLVTWPLSLPSYSSTSCPTSLTGPLSSVTSSALWFIKHRYTWFLNVHKATSNNTKENSGRPWDHDHSHGSPPCTRHQALPLSSNSFSN